MTNLINAKLLQLTTIEQVTNIANSAPLTEVTIEDRYFATADDDFVRITADGNKIVAKQPVEHPHFSSKAMLRAGDTSFSRSDWE